MGENLSNIQIPKPLAEAVQRIDASADVYKYLSNTHGDSVSDIAWRHVWFNFYFWNDLMPIFSSNAPYVVNDIPAKIKIDENGTFQKLFSGRVDSIKEKLVGALNAGTLSEDEAWENCAKKVRSDSHSYREVVDSGLYHIGFLNPEGTLTELGCKYVESCERVNNPYAGIPMEILKASVLQNGQYGAMLHYFYKLSEEKFAQDIFAFSSVDHNGKYKFMLNEYLNWLDDVFTNELHLSKKKHAESRRCA